MHRILLRGDRRTENKLMSLGVESDKQELPGGNYLLYFDIDEDDARWPQIQKLCMAKQASDSSRMVFTREEILRAEWLLLRPDHFSGYPHPESDWKAAVRSGDCSVCGSGWQQTGPYQVLDQVLKEAARSKRHFTSLFWGYPLLAVKEVFDAMEQEDVKGYERWPLTLHSSGRSSEQVSQIFVSHTTSPGTVVGDELLLQHVTCQHRKYLPLQRGQLSIRSQAITPGLDFQRTYEWFGDGKKAYQEVLISSKVAQMIGAREWKGVKLHPVLLVR
jgi:hypothetical protein